MIDSCAEKTYAATTITDIVSHARISRTTFYKRFGDKRACFAATVSFCLDELQEVARDARSPADSPPEAVRRATAAILARMAAKPAMAQLLTGDAVSVDPGVALRYRKILIPALEGLWESAGAHKNGYIDPGLAFSRAQLLVFNQTAAGRSDDLLALLPDIVYLAVAPFGGHEEALAQARLAQSNGRPADER
ncbi:MAG TPA: helix-turn-helix domain-containing protein [Solirubrobacterales bacterium]|nr:helix-turn-helix domain-containing protein [Solirubrobacterales bacterium]